MNVDRTKILKVTWFGWVVTVVVVLAVGGLIFLIVSPQVNQIPTTNNSTVTNSDILHPEINLSEYPELARRLEAFGAVKESKRPNYFGSLQLQIFQYLPPMPRDFYWVSGMVQLAIIKDINDIRAEYYKQPEFYPRFEEVGVTMMKNADPARYAPWGFGSYPSELMVSFDTKNGTIGGETTAWFTMRSSWLVETYQGLQLTPSFPAKAELGYNSFSDRTRNVTQNPDELSKYFQIEIVSAEPKCERGVYYSRTGRCEWVQSNSGGCYANWNEITKTCGYTPSPYTDTILLEPAFPIFQYGWTQKLGVRIKAMPNTPKGKYLIGVDAISPREDISNKWFNEFKLAYVAGSLAGIGKPWLQIGVEVT